MSKYERILVAVGLVVALVVGIAFPKAPGWQEAKRNVEVGAAQVERIGIMSQDDCYLINGADLIGYSDRLSTEKFTLYANNGNASFDGTVSIGTALSLTGGAGVSSLLDAANGFEVTGNITQTSGTALLNVVAVTSTLSANTINVTNQVTVGAGVDIVGALEVTGTSNLKGNLTIDGALADTSGSVEINDSVVITGVLSDGGDSFRINDNTIVTGNLTVSGSASYSSATVVVPFSDTSGSLRMNDDVLITGTLSMAGVINDTGTVVRVDDSLLVTGTITTADYVYAEGYIAAANNDVRILDSVLITGSLAVQGEVSDQGTLFRINDNSLVTGTLGVSGQATLGSASVTGLTTASNGVSATGGVTVTGYTTATTWAGMGSMYGAISTTVEYTTANSIVLNAVAPKLIVPFTTSGPAADMAGISDGSYIGQLLILKSVETTAGHTLVITQGENVDDTLTLDVDDCAMLFWDGSDWRVISFYDET